MSYYFTVGDYCFFKTIRWDVDGTCLTYDIDASVYSFEMVPELNGISSDLTLKLDNIKDRKVLVCLLTL